MSQPMKAPDFAGSCPIPLSDYPTVQLAHGGGGRLSAMLTERLFVAAFGNPALNELHDAVESSSYRRCHIRSMHYQFVFVVAFVRRWFTLLLSRRQLVGLKRRSTAHSSRLFEYSHP